MSEALARLQKIQREIQLLSHAAALLGWDQETGMPQGAVAERAEQMALLEGLAHERASSPEIGELLERLGPPQRARDDREAALLRETRRAYDRATRLPRDLVEALARQASLSQALWVRARKESRFELFRDALAEILRLTIEKAEALGYRDRRYDALLDEYEPWTTTRDVAAVFGPLEGALSGLADRIAASPRRMPRLKGRFAVPVQRELSQRMLRDLGFDMSRGRLDVSAHPFTATVGRCDVRLTTRFDESSLTSALLGTIHECGHGLYEQGLDPALDGTVLADAASLGMHESQSRFWENVVGRSEAFWRRYERVVRDLFPEALSGVSLDDLVRSVNRVEPSLIRVEADEVTYGLHIVLRFNLETRLVAGDLAVADLPAAWAEESRRLLGIAPGRDAEGVLQDIHWSMGSIGYFPTYALGNLYSAQIADAMRRDLGDLGALIERGDFGAMLGWLRRELHVHGRVYPAAELCRRITGSSLDPAFYLRYLEEKFAPIYGI